MVESDTRNHEDERTHSHTKAAVAVSFASSTDDTTEPTALVLSSPRLREEDRFSGYGAI